MKKQISIRRRLLYGISIPIIIVGAIVALFAFLFSWHEIEEVYDAQLAHSAKVLLQITQHEIIEAGKNTVRLGAENPNLKHKYEKNISFRIWQNEALVTQSPNAADFNVSPPPGFSDQIVGSEKWRFFTFIEAKSGIRIETAERYAIRYELIWQLMAALLFPVLLFFPAIFLIVWIGMRQSLKPLLQLSEDVDARSSEDFSDIPTERAPQEVSPLLKALNRLFSRMEESFRREREFTDHAAHELRTPLAAMKTQTQVLIKKLKGNGEVRESLDNLESTIDRSTHLVEQLLVLSRMQSERFEKQRVDLSELVHKTALRFQPFAQAKNIRFKSDIAPDIRINGHELSLEILLGNIVDNAIKYTPSGGSVQLDLGPGHIKICDTGVGLNNEEKQKAFNRFLRLDKSGQTGSGLGLSIAEWIAAAHDIQISLQDNEPSGLCVLLKWE